MESRIKNQLLVLVLVISTILNIVQSDTHDKIICNKNVRSVFKSLNNIHVLRVDTFTKDVRILTFERIKEFSLPVMTPGQVTAHWAQLPNPETFFGIKANSNITPVAIFNSGEPYGTQYKPPLVHVAWNSSKVDVLKPILSSKIAISVYKTVFYQDKANSKNLGNYNFEAIYETNRDLIGAKITRLRSAWYEKNPAAHESRTNFIFDINLHGYHMTKHETFDVSFFKLEPHKPRVKPAAATTLSDSRDQADILKMNSAPDLVVQSDLDNHFYVFWKDEQNRQFYTFQKPDEYDNEADEDENYGLARFIFDVNKHHYLPINNWVGCPPELCLDGTIDAASFIIEQQTGYHQSILYRGQYRFITPLNVSLGKDTSLDYYKLIPHGGKNLQIEAAFSIGSSEFIITRDAICVFADYRHTSCSEFRSLSDSFPELTFSGQPLIDAAMYLRSRLYLFSGSVYYTYHVITTGFNKVPKFNDFKGPFRIKDKWQQSWHNLDAVIHDHKFVYFFKNDFHVKFNLDNDKLAVNPIQSFNVLWKCPRELYASRYPRAMGNFFDNLVKEFYLKRLNAPRLGRPNVILHKPTTTAPPTTTTIASTTPVITTTTTPEPENVIPDPGPGEDDEEDEEDDQTSLSPSSTTIPPIITSTTLAPKVQTSNVYIIVSVILVVFAAIVIALAIWWCCFRKKARASSVRGRSPNKIRPLPPKGKTMPPPVAAPASVPPSGVSKAPSKSTFMNAAALLKKQSASTIHSPSNVSTAN